MFITDPFNVNFNQRRAVFIEFYHNYDLMSGCLYQSNRSFDTSDFFQITLTIISSQKLGKFSVERKLFHKIFFSETKNFFKNRHFLHLQQKVFLFYFYVVDFLFRKKYSASVSQSSFLPIKINQSRNERPKFISSGSPPPVFFIYYKKPN